MTLILTTARKQPEREFLHQSVGIIHEATVSSIAALEDQSSSKLHNVMQVLLLGAPDLLALPQLDHVLPKVLKLAAIALPADAYAIWRADETRSHWHTLASDGLSGDYSFSVEASSATQIDAAPIVAADVQSSPALSSRSSVYVREGIVSLVAVPMKFAGEVRGTLCFYFRKPHSFTDVEVQAGSLLASISASAIATAESYEEQAFERLRSEFLADAGEVLASSLDFQTTLQKVASLAVPAIADWCSVYTYSDGQLRYVTVAHQDPAKLALAEEYRRRYPEQIRPGSPTERLLQYGEPGLFPVIPEELLEQSIEDKEQLQAIKQLGLRSVIEVPIICRKTVTGLLRLISAESRRIFNERDLKLAEELGRRAGVAIENARLYQALRAQQAEQKLILDTLPSLVAVVDRDQRYQFVNRAYSEWFGVTTDLTGTCIRELVGEMAYEKVRQYIERALAGEHVQYEAEVPFSRGGTRHIRAVYVPRRNDTEVVTGYVAFISDVTAEKRAFEDIRTNEERFRGIFTNASVPMVVTKLDGSFIRANAAYCNLTGYTEEELRTTAFHKLTHPEDLGHNMDLYRELLEGKIPNFTIEKRYIRKDGEIAWIRAGASILHDAYGRPTEVIGIGEDITARKAAEIQRNELMAELTRERSELRSTVEQLRMIEDTVGAGTWYFDVRTGISHWPPGISRLWGLPPVTHQVHLDQFVSQIHPDDRERVQDVVRQSLESRDHYEVEFRVLWPDKSVHWLSARGAVVCDESGTSTGILGIALEATERVKTQEALRQSEKLAATGRLAATIAHEINNPLEAVTNLLFLSREDEALPNHIREYLVRADDELRRVAHIARQTLGFYRESVNPQNVNVSDAVEQVLEMYKHRLASKDVQLKLEIEPQTFVFAKQGELRQVISNVVLNAVDAVSMRGSISIRLHQRRSEIVRLIVADDGPGISKANRKNLFQPFFTTKKDVGTGLGLWVSKGIVEGAGGNIHVRSAVAQKRCGTAFVVDLPRSGSGSAL